MNRVLAFKFAELFDFEATGSILFLLGRCVVPTLALGTFQRNNLAHDQYPIFFRAIAYE